MATESSNNRAQRSASSRTGTCQPPAPDLRGDSRFPFETPTAPTTRPDLLARARALVADTDYPSDAVLDRVARRLSIHLSASLQRASDKRSARF